MLVEQKQLTEQEAQRFRRFVDANYWQFAKTYAAFCPHEYTLRKWDKTGDYKWFVKIIHTHGFYAKYGKNKAKYFIDRETGYYYFMPDFDFTEDGEVKPQSSLINRSHLNEFEFIEEETLFGAEIKVKRLPPEKRKPW